MGNKCCCRNKIKENVIIEEKNMTINPIYNMTFEETFFEEEKEVACEAGTPCEAITPCSEEKTSRPKLNRKSKNEINEEYYNHSKDALQDLDNYLFDFFK